MTYTLFRDDDISVTTDVDLLIRTHNLFLKHNKTHTVAIEMERLWENKEVWFFLMTAKNLRVGLHGWSHAEYWKLSAEECESDIRKSLDYWKTVTQRGKYNAPKITTFYPPWNKVGDGLIEACERCGLTLDARVGGEVYNFHYWAFIDANRLSQLEQALKA